MLTAAGHFAGFAQRIAFLVLPLLAVSLPLPAAAPGASQASSGVQGRLVAQIPFRVSSGLIVDGDVGELVFNRFHLILDYAHKKIHIAPNKFFDRPFEYDMSGLVMEQDREDVFYVLQVIENSPAAEQGLIKGDRIVALNGKDIRDYRFSEVFALLRQEGREVKLTVERNRERLDKTLTLRRLI